MSATRTVKVEVTLPDQFLSDVLTTAVESGHASVWYWAEAETLVRVPGDISDVDPETGLTGLSVTKIVGLRDGEDKSQNAWGDVTLDTVALGIQRLLDGTVTVRTDLADHLFRAVSGDSYEPDAGEVDSDLADVIVQAGLFGELVYG